jgi:hypothetical protein
VISRVPALVVSAWPAVAGEASAGRVDQRSARVVSCVTALGRCLDVPVNLLPVGLAGVCVGTLRRLPVLGCARKSFDGLFDHRSA